MTGNIIELKYGSEKKSVAIPERARVEVLQPPVSDSSNDPESLIRNALTHPIDTKPLKEIAKGKNTAVILVSGKTRITGSEIYLPLIIEELVKAGLTEERISIVFATGTHEQMTHEDKLRVVGEKINPQVRLLGHNCKDDDNLVFAGQTSFGNQVFVNAVVMEADLKILTGRITHHYFAGFTGGRKAILPGVSAFKTILHNHRLVMSPRGGSEDRAVHGNLKDNPIHLDMLEAAEFVKPDFVFNTILDTRHNIVHCVAGDFVSAHQEGCRLADDAGRIPVKKPVDLVIASCGGYPYDINFFQTFKAIFSCEKVLKENGTIILCAECPKGIHPSFFRWFDHGDFKTLDKAIWEDYDLAGHNSYLIRRFLLSHRVIMVSAVPKDDIKRLGFLSAEDLEQALSMVDIRKNTLIYVVPEANSVLLESDPALKKTNQEEETTRMNQVELENGILTTSEIKEKLRTYLMDNFAAADDVEIGDDHNLLELGIIDSLSLASIIEYIEEEFEIKVSPKDFFPGRFDTIAKAADYILDFHRRRKS